ncbi:MAG: BspA family leucine-rich repeat surface protein [Deltaproteobacteria bacterium]
MKNVFFCLVLLVFSGISITLKAQCITSYTSQNGGDFSLDANWVGGTAPVNPIPPGVTVTIQHAMYNSGILENNGAIVVTPSGSFTNQAGAIYRGNGTFAGSFINQGTVAPGITHILPTLFTAAVTGITGTSAVSGGTICYDGGTSVSARGVCWNTSPNPDISLQTKTNDQGNTFTSNLTGLNPLTTYYVRSYATNSTGTTYGNQLIFTTEAASDPMSEHFVTTWKTDNPGTSCPSCITIPTTGGGYNYDVDWDNDGTFDEFGITGNVTHDFGTAGTYTIRIRGDFPRIYFYDLIDQQKILSVDQWGSIAWTNMMGAFRDCNNLNVNAVDIPNLSSVTDMSWMFYGCTVLNPTGASSTAFNSWNTSNVLDMNYLFCNAWAFNTPIGNWNTSNVTNMFGMFQSASSFNQPLGNWNTSNVMYMGQMFAGASSFNQYLGDWNTVNVLSVYYMFYSAWAFNQSLGTWNISNISQMDEMLTYTGISITNYDNTLIAWDAAGYTNKDIGVGGLQYCNSASARTNMITNKGWTFNGDALSCPVPLCTALTEPLNAAINVPVTTNLTWAASANATGYKLTVGTTSGGTEILNDQDVGNVLTYDLASDLPYSTTIYVNIIPYNATGDAQGCTEESLTTESNAFNCGTSTVTFDYNGASVTYGTVMSAGRCWLDRNLGATRVAESSADALSYGDLFQWGRLDDGHQMRTSETTTDLSNSDVPGHGNFILAPDNPYDWRSPSNNNLWQGEGGTNNPCPEGFRLPTNTEWDSELESWSTYNAAGAFNSPLKLSLSGWRSQYTGVVANGGIEGAYWSSTVNGSRSLCIDIFPWSASLITIPRATGFAVRCVKDETPVGSIGSLDCPGAIINGILTEEVAASGVTAIVGYTGGNGGTHSGQTLASTGVTGLTATVPAGSFANGAGSLTYEITGTPASSGTAVFSLSIGGQTCDLSVLVQAAVPTCTSLTDPLNSATNVPVTTNLTWAASANATGYKLTVGTTSGGTEILNSQDVGNVLTYDLASDLPYSSLIYITIIPYNATGDAVGCTEESFTTENLSTPFITTWKSDNPGSSCNSCITIPTFPGETYNYDVDWDNDGTFDEFGITGNVTHDFGSAGTYTIQIRGIFPRIFFNGQGDNEKIISIDQWGDIAWSSMVSAFYSCINMNLIAEDIPDLSSVTQLTDMFGACNLFNPIGNASIAFSNWNTQNITDMSGMFAETLIFNQPIGNWNTGVVQAMGGMFQGAIAFNQNLNSWNTENVTDMNGMFSEAHSFNQSLDGWNTGNVTDMSLMFQNANSFNKPIGNWNMSNVTEMSFMFQGAASFNQSIILWNTGSVTHMDYMFHNAASFNQPISNFNLSSVANMVEMLTGSGISTENYDNTLIAWDAAGYINKNVGVGGLHYCNSSSARNNMITNKGWTFNGDALSCPVPLCTALSNPVNGSINVPVTTNLSWASSANATGYKLKVGTTSGGTEILNNQDVGNVLTYDLAADLPYSTIIYVTIIPYNAGSDAAGCTEESFTTIACSDLVIEIISTNISDDKIFYNYTITNNGPSSVNLGGPTTSISDNLGFQRYISNDNIFGDTDDVFHGGSLLSNTQAIVLEAGASIILSSWFYNMHTPGFSHPDHSYIFIQLILENVLPCDIINNNSINTIGCTDSGAHNYDSESDIDDGFCQTCSDGIKNGDETGTDCGGTLCPQCPFGCTNLINPVNGAINVPVASNLTWAATNGATGYRLTIGTTPGGTDILNNVDLGNVTTYDPPYDFPVSSTIYVTIIPYNGGGDASGCAEEGFTTTSSTFTCGTSTITFTYNGASVTYGTVVGANNKCWLDRNLGASQVATSSGDAASYGDLFQWGRLADGHQIRTSGTTNDLSTSDVPGHGNFITVNSNPYDWRSPQNSGLWQGFNGINNPCPNGYRIPSIFELDDERASWTSNDAAGAINSPLKLPTPGSRSPEGILYYEGDQGLYWSSNVNGIYSRYLNILQGVAYSNNLVRAGGFSVRCIKDETPAGSIGSLDCPGATINGTLTVGVAASGVSAAVGYTGGNGGTHSGQTVTSTGVTGLTATLPAGSFANGAGTLTYDITGTPTSSGTAVFALNIGGQTCDLSVLVQAAVPICTNLTDPLNGATNVPVATNLNWAASANATGYKLTVGTTSGGTEILNDQDVGNVLTYDLASDLPYSTTIYVTIIPYNVTGDAQGCTEESFTTVSNTFNCGTSTVTFDYNGSSVTYGTVMSAGRCWLDRNLGASQVATSSDDAAAYGDLFQWGRLDDGHQVRTSGTTSDLSNNDVPGHGNFIIAPNNPYDWRSPQNNNLWQGVNGINNPCPTGYRLPSYEEWNAELATWSPNNAEGALASPLKLPMAGFRNAFSGAFNEVGSIGSYCSNYAFSIGTQLLVFRSNLATMAYNYRATGMSLRCIKDETPAGSVGNLDCPGATINGTLTDGVAASGVSAVVGYTGGNGGTHSGQIVTSTGVTGLTATLPAGTFANGSGTLTYEITGTPAGSGTAVFALNIGGQTCDLSVPVGPQPFVCGTSTVTFDYNGSTVTYGTVMSAGRCWLDRNLGASQVAISGADALSYGDLFQWGRLDDGHQVRTSGTTTDLSNNDVPGHGNYILSTSYPNDWRSPQNSNLWQGVNGINNPCPAGYRMPTETEWNAERLSWSSNNADGAFASPLKMPISGYRYSYNGTVSEGGGYYWSSTTDGTESRFLIFYSGLAGFNNYERSDGMSVRCIKDICAAPNQPTSGLQIPSESQIEWNWNGVIGASGYKFNTVNNYATAIDNGTSTSYTQTNLICNTVYTLYVWAYSCGNSPVLQLNQSTSICTGAIVSLDCPGAVINGTLSEGVQANGVTALIGYSGGNGGSHSGQTVASTGVTGLTAILSAGSFTVGNGILTYAINGVPLSSGTAVFALNIGGQNCNLNVTVGPQPFVCGTSTVTFNYNGSSVIYGTVISVGRCWLDRNLGASRVAISSTDASAYGDIFEWGRLIDGHQIRTSSISPTLSSTDIPGHNRYIRALDSPYDWRSPQNPNLWQGVSGINNPCPSGYRLPTETELNDERLSWSSNDSNGAFNSPLKLPLGGYRYQNGGLYQVGLQGTYWSSTINGTNSRYLRIESSNSNVYNGARADGHSVRCLKD